MYLKMFSSTTMASSMTMPVASESASMVMLLSEKPRARITAKVPMIEIGMARRGDHRDAPVAHEEEHDQRREQAAEDQVVLNLLERLADEPRLIAGRADLDVRRQRRLDALDAAP